MKKIRLLIILSFISVTLIGQNENILIRKGNKGYTEGNFKDAEVDYRKALESKNNSYKAEFNLGDALYEQENYEESSKKFMEYAEKKSEKDLKSKAYHNLGNSLLKEKKYAESVKAYKNALRNNPHDLDTKYNLEYAKQKLIKQQQQQQQQQQKNKDKENKKENKEKDKEKKENKDQSKENKEKKNQGDKDKKQQQKQDKNKGDKKQQQKQQRQQEKKISKKDAERMLKALKDNEKETLKKINLKKAKAAGIRKSEKDW